MTFTTSALIASWVAILLLGLVVSGLVRQVHRLSRGRPHTVRAAGSLGIGSGSRAPEVAELFGDDLGTGGVLLFLSADCRTCRDVLAEAGRWSRRAEAGPAFRALYAGPAPREALEGDGPVRVREERDDLFTTYDAIATPFAVAVDGEGRVLRSVPLGSPEALTALLDDVYPHPARSGR